VYPLSLGVWLTPITRTSYSRCMGATFDDDRLDDRSGTRKHFTTVVLKEQPDGQWLATQHGVDVEGHGPTAAAAATEYCRRVEHGE